MNKAMRLHILTFIAVLLVGPATVQGADTVSPPKPVKKLIEYGWDVPYPGQLRRDIRAMEKKPFDGIIFRLQE